MKSALRKDIFKEIKSTFNRFIAIFAIVALGVGFFAGLKATTPDMKLTADKYFDDQALMDIRILSTMGFTEEDIAAIKNQPGIESTVPGYSMDALVDMPNGTKAVRIHTQDFSLPENLQLNKPVLLEGRMPKAPNECLVDAQGNTFEGNGGIGDVYTISDTNNSDMLDVLAEKQFTAVGIVNSPYYISFQRGNTDIGNGSISSYIIIPQTAIDSEYYTEVLATIDSAKPLNSYSDEYTELIDANTEIIEEFGKERSQIRYDDILAEAQIEIDDAEQELANARQKLADGKAEFDEKTIELQDANTEFSNKKSEAEQKLADARQEIADGDQKIADAKVQIADNRKKLKSGEAKYASAKSEAEQKILAGQAEIDAGNAQLAPQKQQFEQASAELTAAWQQHQMLIEQAEHLRQAGMEEEAAALQAQADELKPVLDLKQQELDLAATQIAAAELQLNDAQATLNSASAEATAQLDSVKSQLDSGKAQLSSANTQLKTAESDLQSGKEEYTEAEQTANTEIADAQAKLDDAEIKLADAEIEIADGQQDINEGQTKLDDAKAELADLELPEWFALGRDTNPGYVGYGSDADRVGAIAVVFPLFFFLVAALVCLTTMTRMVEEQRMQIGVLKALGYSRGAIASKYIIYALIASVSGSAAGLAVGFWVFPTAVFQAYSIMYTLPSIITAFHADLAIQAAGGAIACTVLAALWACLNELMAVPADLVRPKAPPAGKRVFLEKITGIWKRLNFTQKVTVRNLFRYKKRFFMTVIGIGGCAALMLTGFGLKDSIVGIVERQFDDIYSYDARINIDSASSSTADTELNKMLDAMPKLESYLYIQQQPATAHKNSQSMDASAFIAENPQKLHDFIEFKNRQTKQAVAFPADGVVITEKVANTLGIGIGDSFELKKGDTDNAELKVGGITENYINNFVYFTPEQYQAAFGKPELKEVIIRLKEDLSEEQETQISAMLLEGSEVESVNFITKLAQDFDDIMKSLDAVVLLLIFCANLLAFIVLYNLVNINITERLREIATIKVLGFYNKEVAAYVYRENIVLTAIGTLIGLVGGVFLHQFVVSTAEVDMVMFERSILPLSYVYSTALTFIFALIVNLIMNFRLRKISMVESLKSTE